MVTKSNFSILTKAHPYIPDLSDLYLSIVHVKYNLLSISDYVYLQQAKLIF